MKKKLIMQMIIIIFIAILNGCTDNRSVFPNIHKIEGNSGEVVEFISEGTNIDNNSSNKSEEDQNKVNKNEIYTEFSELSLPINYDNPIEEFYNEGILISLEVYLYTNILTTITSVERLNEIKQEVEFLEVEKDKLTSNEINEEAEIALNKLFELFYLNTDLYTEIIVARNSSKEIDSTLSSIISDSRKNSREATDQYIQFVNLAENSEVKMVESTTRRMDKINVKFLTNQR